MDDPWPQADLDPELVDTDALVSCQWCDTVMERADNGIARCPCCDEA